MDYDYNYEELLKYIDPCQLTYQEWVNVGMALKHEGCYCSLWDSWSKRDPKRYHSNECFIKWETFNGNAAPVTGATIVQMAKEGGWTAFQNRELDWDDEIGRHKDDQVVIDYHVEPQSISAPRAFEPVKELTRYLETLFNANENVGYVVKSYEKDGKYIPADRGSCSRTAGELIEELSKCNGDIGAVLGDYNKEAGAWIRFNPLDGKGVKNENVTEYRYALVESDTEELEKQNAIIRELDLPVACLVFSGGKSLHAIVKIEAADYNEYRKRVDYLYKICRKNGLEIDQQNRNPSRLSRMPGVQRGEQIQYIVDTNIGKRSFAEWQEYIESINDELPDPETLSEHWDNLPELAPSLIEGILRQGHKMLIAGPSKAGKSVALIELCIAIAEGRKWLGLQCAQGKVLYVNLELDNASCLHRFKNIYEALNFTPDNIKNIDIWNLRGKSIPMNLLAPKLIRRAAKKNYIAIVIDPIYKVITGDENSASQMAEFCNQFDKVCNELGCAVIYCHHHSKGAQGGKKSMDRASGSGVFARDPDAMLDLIELELTEGIIKQKKNMIACGVYLNKLREEGLEDKAGPDDECSSNALNLICSEELSKRDYEKLLDDVAQTTGIVDSLTAWRIDATLREFPKIKPINMWFDYPVHKLDTDGSLSDLQADDGYTGRGAPWKQNFANKKSKEERAEEKQQNLREAFNKLTDGDKTKEVKIADLAKTMGVGEKAVKGYIDKSSDFWRENGFTGLKNK